MKDIERIIKGEIPIICDTRFCLKKGDIPRCYLENYEYCRHYEKNKEKKDKKIY